VSAQAPLIALLLFWDPRGTRRSQSRFPGARTEHLLSSAGTASFIQGPGIYVKRLAGRPGVDHFVTNELIERWAQQAAQGRLLLYQLRTLGPRGNRHLG